MNSRAYEVKCLLCATTVGEVVHGVVGWRPLTNGQRPLLRREGGTVRCPHCDGSLYLEPVEEFRVPNHPGELRRAIADEQARSTDVRAAG